MTKEPRKVKRNRKTSVGVEEIISGHIAEVGTLTRKMLNPNTPEGDILIIIDRLLKIEKSRFPVPIPEAIRQMIL